MTPYRWFPVNCCCQPDVLFGFLRLPEGGLLHVVKDRDGTEHRIELKRLRQARTFSSALMLDSAKVALEIPETAEEIAIYSDDRPLEFWRTLPGFREVSDKSRPTR